MRIIIPMAGESKRFQDAGYLTPKQYIDIDGKPMIHWVCEMFSPEDDFIFIMKKEHAKNKEFIDKLETIVPKFQIVEIEKHNQGPLYTALAADSIVEDDEQVIFCYCDFYQHWDYRKFLWKVNSYDGGIAVFKGFHPASFGSTYYAYLLCNEKDEMIELREKQSFTESRHEEYASSGVYYVKSWAIYKRYAKKILEDKTAIKGEYYISLIFNPMVKDNLNVVVFEIDKFICWGTPEDLEQYNFWSDYFRNDAQMIFNRRLNKG